MYEPGHTPAGPEAVLDPDRLAAVFGDDRQAIREILVMAIGSLKTLVASLRASLEQPDLTAAKAAVHEIKGVSANVGAQELSSAALALETELANAAGRPPEALAAPVALAYERFAAQARAAADAAT